MEKRINEINRCVKVKKESPVSSANSKSDEGVDDVIKVTVDNIRDFMTVNFMT